MLFAGVVYSALLCADKGPVSQCFGIFIPF